MDVAILAHGVGGLDGVRLPVSLRYWRSQRSVVFMWQFELIENMASAMCVAAEGTTFIMASL